jgi:hypothetical protein
LSKIKGHVRWDNGHQGNSFAHAFYRRCGGSRSALRQGVPMTTRVECASRAALCRQLAILEPANQAIWTAEAEYWSRLSDEKDRGEAGTPVTLGTLAGLRARVARGLANPSPTRLA